MASVTLRPNGVVDDWTPPGPNTSTSDADAADDSDSTYTATQSNSDSLILDLQASGIPVSSTVNSVTIRVRLSTVGTSNTVSTYQRLAGVDSAADSMLAANGDIQTRTGATRTTNPSGAAWSVSDVDALQVKVASPFPTNGEIRAYEVYADVDYTLHSGYSMLI